VIRALAAESASSSADSLRKLLGNPLRPGEVDEARTLVKANGAVGQAIDVARGYAVQASDAFDVAAGAGVGGEGHGPVAAALRSLGDDLIENLPR
jgi:hypothetical protein